MAVRHGLFVANGSTGVTAPQDARLALASLLYGPGVLSGLAVTGSTAGPNMRYVVAAGSVATQRGALATDGLYLWGNDGAVTVDSGAPAPAAGSRYDVIYALHRNANDGFGDANSDPIIGVVVGTAGSTPTVPAVPPGALAFATARVGTNIANASLATITNSARVGPRSTAAIALGGSIAGPMFNATWVYQSAWDLGTLYSAGGIAVSGGTLTVPLAGLYLWSVSVTFPTIGTAHGRAAKITVNGSDAAGGGTDIRGYVAGTPGGVSTWSGVLPLNAGDQVVANMYQNSGSDQSVTPRMFALSRLG